MLYNCLCVCGCDRAACACSGTSFHGYAGIACVYGSFEIVMFSMYCSGITFVCAIMGCTGCGAPEECLPV